MANNPIEIAMRRGAESGMPELTVERIASILNVSRQTVNNYVKNPDSIPLNSLKKLSSATGISLDLLCGSDDKPAGPKITPTYGKYSKKLNRFIKEARKGVNVLEKLQNTLDKGDEMDACSALIKAQKDKLNDIIDTSIQMGRKPTICAFGSSDTGKSTLMNYLIGETIVPAKYSPMTTVPMYVMHESEKPKLLRDKDVADNAIVIGRRKGASDNRISYFNQDLDCIKEEDVIRVGNYRSILEDFGTRDGAYYEKSDYEVDEIYIFADVEVLREFTFIDIPGFGSGDEKDDVGLTLDAAKFDVIFFLSTANAYLRGNELTNLSNIIRTREDLSSLYVLATHAYSVGDPNTLQTNVIEKGCERILRTMTEAEKMRLKISDQTGVSDIKKRCFGFDTAAELYCQNLNECLEKELPQIIVDRLSNAIQRAKDCSKEGIRISKKLLEQNKQERRMPKSPEKEKKKNEEAKKMAAQHLNDISKRLKNSIVNKGKESLEKMENDYDFVMDKEFITSVIERKDFKNKKADLEDLGTYLSGELNDRLKNILSEKSKAFSDELIKELDGYKAGVKSDVADLDIAVDFDYFDFRAAFAAGLTGLTTYGALAVWATVVAAGSNLGAYILVAKVVSALSAIGISVGGTAAATAFVSSIGGPVTIGISLAILAAITAFGIFTGTWKGRVANRIIKAYEEQNALEKCYQVIGDYWRDTVKALEECINSLEKQTNEQYDDALKKVLMNDSAYIKKNTTDNMIYSNCLNTYESMLDELSVEG